MVDFISRVEQIPSTHTPLWRHPRNSGGLHYNLGPCNNSTGLTQCTDVLRSVHTESQSLKMEGDGGGGVLRADRGPPSRQGKSLRSMGHSGYRAKGKANPHLVVGGTLVPRTSKIPIALCALFCSLFLFSEELGWAGLGWAGLGEHTINLNLHFWAKRQQITVTMSWWGQHISSHLISFLLSVSLFPSPSCPLVPRE